MLQQVFMVALGGGIGAALRYLTSEWISNEGFPYATLAVNLVGSFLMGALAIALAEQVISKDLALLFGTGLLGGLTTMSAFSVGSLKNSKLALRPAMLALQWFFVPCLPSLDGSSQKQS